MYVYMYNNKFFKFLLFIQHAVYFVQLLANLPLYVEVSYVFRLK